MKEYDVKITEKLEKIVTVYAESREDAELKVENGWEKSEYVLDSENFVGVDFNVEKERMIEKEMMDVLLVEPGKYPRAIQVRTELEDLRAIVEGNIECTYPFEENVGIILNEEGKLLGLPLNRAIRNEDGEAIDVYAGTFMVVGLSSDDFCSLSPELMEKFEKKFHQPEKFLRMGRGLVILPIPDERVNGKKERNKKVPTAEFDR